MMNDVKAILAEQPGLGRIYLCGCESIHMTIGPVTVNLSPEAFAKVSAMICKAMGEMSGAEGSQNAGAAILDPAELQRSRFTN